MSELLAFTLAWIGISISGAFFPGPFVATTVMESARRGFIAGPLLMLGHYPMELLVIAGLLLGLGPILELKVTSAILGILGGSVLVSWSAIYLLRIYHNGLKLPSETPRTQRYPLIFKGAVVTIANPYFFLWWVAIGSMFLVKMTTIAGIAGVILLAVGHWIVDTGWIFFISFCVGKGMKFMTRKGYKIIASICQIFLLSIGGYFLVNAIWLILFK